MNKIKMKVTFKIDPETLFLLHKIIGQESNITVGRNCGKSMLVELFEKLTKACIAYTGNPNGKKRTLELRYHLAEKLVQTVIKATENNLPPVEMAKLEIFKNQMYSLLL